jgi:hypothetical protein
VALIRSGPLGVTPLYMQTLAGEDPINYSAAEFRQLINSIWPTDGIIGPVSFHVTQADTVGWAVRVSSGTAKVGTYLVRNPDAVTVSMTSIQTQVIAAQQHWVYLAVQDQTVYGDGYYAEIVVGTDEGAGHTVPDAAALLLLAVINVSPGQSNIQNANISAKPANASHGGAFEKLADTTLTSTIVSAHTTYTATGEARARYGAGRVRFEGGIARSSGADFPANDDTVLGTLPYYMRPNAGVWLPAATSGANNCRLNIDHSGVMTVHTVSTCKYVFLDGVSFEVD